MVIHKQIARQRQVLRESVQPHKFPSFTQIKSATEIGRQKLADAKSAISAPRAAQAASVARQRAQGAGLVQKMREGFGSETFNPLANSAPKK